MPSIKWLNLQIILIFSFPLSNIFPFFFVHFYAFLFLYTWLNDIHYVTFHEHSEQHLLFHNNTSFQPWCFCLFIHAIEYFLSALFLYQAWQLISIKKQYRKYLFCIQYLIFLVWYSLQIDKKKILWLYLIPVLPESLTFLMVKFLKQLQIDVME